ncbi:hypothetical protein Ancab_003510 [Ancistrocladus abbreviatus]
MVGIVVGMLGTAGVGGSVGSRVAGNGGNDGFGRIGTAGIVGSGTAGNGGNVGFGRVVAAGIVGSGVAGNGGNVGFGRVVAAGIVGSGTAGNGGNVGFGRVVAAGIVGSGVAGNGGKFGFGRLEAVGSEARHLLQTIPSVLPLLKLAIAPILAGCSANFTASNTADTSTASHQAQPSKAHTTTFAGCPTAYNAVIANHSAA